MPQRKSKDWRFTTRWTARVPLAFMAANDVCPCFVADGDETLVGAFCTWDVRDASRASRVEHELLELLPDAERVVFMQVFDDPSRTAAELLSHYIENAARDPRDGG